MENQPEQQGRSAAVKIQKTKERRRAGEAEIESFLSTAQCGVSQRYLYGIGDLETVEKECNLCTVWSGFHDSGMEGLSELGNFMPEDGRKCRYRIRAVEAVNA